MSTSYVRGITLSNCIMIIDEIQNMTLSEVNSIMTRVGNNTRIMLCGDFRQTDLLNKSSFGTVLEIIYRMPSFECIDFKIDDIVRSDFAKEWIVAYEKVSR